MTLRKTSPPLIAALICLASASTSWAQIFTCIDGYGRKITSDRPIAECKDKDQKELNPNATVKRVVKPSMTAQEQNAVEQKLKADAAEQAALEESRRRNRALLARYPNKTVHDRERNNALAQIDDVVKTAQARMSELALQRKKLDEELEFYKKDPKKIPPLLNRQIDSNSQNSEAQQKFINEQADEKKRIDARFDEELVRLKSLWLQASAPVAPASSASMPLKK